MHVNKDNKLKLAATPDLLQISDKALIDQEKQVLLIDLPTMLPTYRNQRNDLLSKSIDWFLYDENIGY